MIKKTYTFTILAAFIILTSCTTDSFEEENQEPKSEVINEEYVDPVKAKNPIK